MRVAPRAVRSITGREVLPVPTSCSATLSGRFRYWPHGQLHPPALEPVRLLRVLRSSANEWGRRNHSEDWGRHGACDTDAT